MDEGGALGTGLEAGDLALGVAEQWIDRGARRHEPLGRAEEHGDVDVETGGPGDRAHVDAVADLAAASGSDVELGDERGAELGAGGRTADRVEVVQPVEHLGGLLPALGLGALEAVEPTWPEPPRQHVLGPVDPLGPAAQLRRIAERRAQLPDEGEQLERGARLPLGPLDAPGVLELVGGLRGAPTDVVGVADEVCLPVAVAHDPGGPADPLPASRGHERPVGPPGRHIAEQGHHRAAAQAAPVELEELGEHSRDHALAHARARAAVPGDAGSGQVVLDEPGVGAVGGEEHGDAVEAGAGSGGVDDRTDTDAHLVVGVGRRHDGDLPLLRLAVDRQGGSERAAGERLGEGDDGGIGVGVAGDAGDHLDVAALGEGGEQLDLERAQPLGKVDDEAAQAIGHVVPGALGGTAQQVALVVPVGGQERGDLAGDPRRLDTAGRAGEGRRGARTGGADLPVQVAQGDDGRRVVVDARVGTRRALDDLLDGEVDDGGRHRVAALAVQGRCTEHLGEAEHREHVDGGGAATPAERPPGHHPGGVGRHDDGDRGQRVTILGDAHRRRERVERRRAVPGERHLDRHPPDRTDRVSRRAPVPPRRQLSQSWCHM